MASRSRSRSPPLSRPLIDKSPPPRDDGNESYPLHEAARAGDVELVRSLLRSMGPNAINQLDENEWTPLHEGCSRGHTAVVKILLENNADTSARTKFLRTPLHNAAAIGNIDIAQLLLSYGAEIDAVNKETWTPLHRACKQNRIEMALFLIDHGASIYVRSIDGKTPLDLLRSATDKQMILEHIEKTQHQHSNGAADC